MSFLRLICLPLLLALPVSLSAEPVEYAKRPVARPAAFQAPVVVLRPQARPEGKGDVGACAPLPPARAAPWCAGG